MMRHVMWWGVCRAAEASRASELDRRAAALGRKLAKGLETDDEEEEEDFYDVSEMEVSGIVFSPVKRYPWCALLSWALGWKVPACGGFLHLLAFCFCRMSETFSLQLPQTGTVGDLLIPRARGHYLPGFPLLPLVGACSGPRRRRNLLTQVVFLCSRSRLCSTWDLFATPTPQSFQVLQRWVRVPAAASGPTVSPLLPCCGPGLLQLTHTPAKPLA